MHCDNIKDRVPTNRHTKKSNVERPGLQHPYLLRRDNIAQRQLYFRIQFSKLPVLIKLAGEALLDRSAIAELTKAITKTLEAAASADHCLDGLLERDKSEAKAY